MFRKLFFYFFTIINLNLLAQVGGKTPYQFLNIPNSARQLALGGKVLTIIDNTNQANWNPATINLNSNKILSLNYSNYLDGISMGSISYTNQFSRKTNPVYFGANYFNYGTIIKADENGNEQGEFSASDISFAIGYAVNIPKSNIHIGSNIRYIYSTIDSYNSSALAVDFGIIYYTNEKPYILTLVARNVGFQIDPYTNEKENLPIEIAIGGSYRLEKVPLRLYGTIDQIQQWKIAFPNPSNKTTDLEGNTTDENISFFDNLFRHISVGAELFPESIVNIRLGYNFRRSKEFALQNLRSFGGLSLGFGIQFNKVKINYGYSKFHTATNVSTFSLLIDLHRKEKSKTPTRY